MKTNLMPRRSRKALASMPEWLVLSALLLLVCLGTVVPPKALAQEAPNACGPIWGTRHFGPFDFRSPQGNLGVVERAHFTPKVEAGLSGSTGPLGADLNYTLRSFPNHHRALVTTARATKRMKNDQIPGLEWPMECYFERAIRFAPDDAVVRNLYAQWLGDRKRPKEAEFQLEAALRLAGDNPLTHYNIGLLYFDLGNLPAASRQALRARELGWPRSDLIDKLAAAGHGPGRVAAPAEPGASAPAARPADPPAAAPASAAAAG